MISELKAAIRSNAWLKSVFHRILIPKNEAKPRWFVPLLVNRFVHKRGKKSVIRFSARVDVFPFNRFELGDHSVIEDFCTINNGVGDVLIGKRTRIGLGSVVIGPVEIGNNCIFAQNIVISGLNHGYENPDIAIKDQPVFSSQITIEDDCWIGANVSITAGITIGKHSVVGSGSVVTKSVPPFHVVVGNPARAIKRYDFEQKVWVKLP